MNWSGINWTDLILKGATIALVTIFVVFQIASQKSFDGDEYATIGLMVSAVVTALFAKAGK